MREIEIIMNLLFIFVITIKGIVCHNHSYSNDRSQAIPILKRYYSLQEQIHIAIGENLSEMVIMWSEWWPRNKTSVTYGLFNGKYTHIQTGHSVVLQNVDKIQFIHCVTLKKLKPNVKYKYRVGSPQSWSEELSFTTMRRDNKWVPKVAIFGDMGWIKGYSIPNLIEMTERNAFDMALHIGDIAYELYTFKGKLGDGFMKAIQPMASRIPYMVIPGNHEYHCYRDQDMGYNFKRRFKMPQNNDNEFYTFKLGKALFVAFSTEYYFRIENGSNDKVALQKRWLERVLTEANEPQNRALQPWIIGLGHRSLYCSTTDSDCVNGMTTDIGDTDTKMLELEEILHRQGVDITFWGHYHYYDRFYPVYNRTIVKTTTNPYINPLFNIHILSGSAGMDGTPEGFAEPAPEWSAFRTKAFGYTVLNIVNESHIHLKQIDVNKPKTPIDSLWVIQEKHKKRNNKSIIN